MFDNYDNPRFPGGTDPDAIDIRNFLPGADHGFIIITTRSSEVGLGTLIPVGKMKNIQDSLEILARTSKQKLEVDSQLYRLLIEVIYIY